MEKVGPCVFLDGVSERLQHDEWITIRHLPILGRPVYIRMRPKRYNCARCVHRKGKQKVTTTQQLSWHRAKSPNTRPYEEQVLLQLVNSTIEDVRVKEGLGYDGVEGIVKRNISTTVDWGELERLDVLGIDEIALKKGHQDYVVPITARLDEGRLKILAVLPNRKKKTVKKFLRSIPQRLRATIHTVCLDMWKHYIAAVEEVFGAEVDITVGPIERKKQTCPLMIQTCLSDFLLTPPMHKRHTTCGKS